MNSEGHMEVVRQLCSFERRLAGTDAERRAANWAAERLRRNGRRAQLEPIHVHPQVWAIHAAHLALGIAASLLSLAVPVAGFVLALVTAVSLYFDFNTRFHLVRRLFFRRASQNVFSPGRRTDAAARLILCAHIDTARTGLLFGERARRREARIPPRLRIALAGPRLIFWSLALLVPVLGARLAGIEAGWLSIVQLAPTFGLLVGAFLLLDVQLSDVVPGANDNAAGVAVALSVAERLDAEQPANLDVCVLLTGGEECGMEGMRSFVRAHRDQLERDSTYFVVIEMPGGERLHYLTGEGLAVSYGHDVRLAELCEAVSAASHEQQGGAEAEPVALAVATDALPATLAGYPATVVCTLAENGLPPLTYHTPEDTPEHVDPSGLEATERFTIALAGAIDREAGRRGAAPAG